MSNVERPYRDGSRGWGGKPHFRSNSGRDVVSDMVVRRSETVAESSSVMVETPDGLRIRSRMLGMCGRRRKAERRDDYNHGGGSGRGVVELRLGLKKVNFMAKVSR